LAELGRHLRYLEDAAAAAIAAPLSSKRMRLALLLADVLVDRLFVARDGMGDVLEFRRSVAAASPALGLAMALSADPSLLGFGSVPADYANIDTADYMVSLYNGQQIQVLELAGRPAQAVLAEALVDLRNRVGTD
jgi:hypothetical protein